VHLPGRVTLLGSSTPPVEETAGSSRSTEPSTRPAARGARQRRRSIQPPPRPRLRRDGDVDQRAYTKPGATRCIVSAMRTNIDIDDQLLSAARELLGTHTKRETVNAALRDVVERRRRLALLELRGEVRWEGDLEELRAGRTFSA
jgi:Arc/MetJ family transcription regulator